MSKYENSDPVSAEQYRSLLAELRTERELSHELGVRLYAYKAKYAELVADYDAVCLDHEAMIEGLQKALEGLVEKWRERAKRIEVRQQKCADELDSIIHPR